MGERVFADPRSDGNVTWETVRARCITAVIDHRLKEEPADKCVDRVLRVLADHGIEGLEAPPPIPKPGRVCEPNLFTEETP